MTGKRRIRIIILGPSIKTRGGISTVIRLHIASIGDPFRLTVIPTYRGEGRPMDLYLFLLSIIRTGWLSLFLKPGEVLFHIHSSTGGSYFRKSILARILRVRGHAYLFHLHAGDFDTHIARIGRNVALKPLLHAKKVIVLSESWADRIAELLPELHNLVVLYNPCPFDAMLEKSSSRDGSVTRFLYTGRIMEKKGSYDLIRACAPIRNLPFTLDLYGDGEVGAASALIKEMGLNEKVHAIKWIRMKDVEAFYSRYDVFVLPSWLEGMAMSVLEAIACSMPVIATDILGMNICVHHEENGLLVPVGDLQALSAAMARLIWDKELRARMGNASRRLALAQFTPAVIAGKLMDIYREVLEDGT